MTGAVSMKCPNQCIAFCGSLSARVCRLGIGFRCPIVQVCRLWVCQHMLGTGTVLLVSQKPNQIWFSFWFQPTKGCLFLGTPLLISRGNRKEHHNIRGSLVLRQARFSVCPLVSCWFPQRKIQPCICCDSFLFGPNQTTRCSFWFPLKKKRKRKTKTGFQFGFCQNAGTHVQNTQTPVFQVWRLPRNAHQPDPALFSSWLPKTAPAFRVFFLARPSKAAGRASPRRRLRRATRSCPAQASDGGKSTGEVASGGRQSC